MMLVKSNRIYFICIQNRCRSQIAEAWAKHYATDDLVIESAGIEHADIHPHTIQVMEEKGIPMSGHVSKTLDLKKYMSSEYVVKMCEQVAERCPVVPFGVKSLAWDIKDPLPTGNIEDVRVARDAIEIKVIALLKEMGKFKQV